MSDEHVCDATCDHSCECRTCNPDPRRTTDVDHTAWLGIAWMLLAATFTIALVVR